MIPANTADTFSNLMESCWDEDSKTRPPFSAIILSLETLYSSMFVQCEENPVRGVATSTC